jgi:PHP family Zn ribbon phosphoesterase
LYYGVGMNSKKIWNIYWKLIEDFQDEFNVLLFVDREDLLDKEIEKGLADLIIKNRKGKIKVKPGYDGEYGEAILEDVAFEKQSKLF